MYAYSAPTKLAATPAGLNCTTDSSYHNMEYDFVVSFPSDWSSPSSSDDEIEQIKIAMQDMELEALLDGDLGLNEPEGVPDLFEDMMAEAEKFAKREAKKRRKADRRQQRELRRLCRDVEEALAKPNKVNPFTPEMFSVDLIRCPPIDPNVERNSLNHLATDYVRAIRLLRVKQRWCRMSVREFTKETGMLLNYFDQKPDECQPFQPLADWFTLYDLALPDLFRNMARTRAKQVLMRQLLQIAEDSVASTRENLEEFLKAQNAFIPTAVRKAVQDAVEEDCEKRGSLNLMSIPEFVFEIEHCRGMSSKWSWYD
ncbi:hypothetical protein J1614_006862 [Plenodomus biglobosus]|nr:hypothetical protein J1614_006862 [Plenodomus biglobosus]